MGIIDSKTTYKAPQAEVIEVKVQGVLCQSNGNMSMYEKDYGDGGFEEQ